MLLVGLTGGIGSGKSTAADLLRRKGAVVIDADVAARAVVEPGSLRWPRSPQRFGAEILLTRRRSRPSGLRQSVRRRGMRAWR